MPKIFAYTDGACSGNPGPGGWGVILQAKENSIVVKELELYGGEKETTNNIGLFTYRRHGLLGYDFKLS